jgi:alpha-L-rhamnosidase
MLNISWMKIENLKEGCVTDTAPTISFALESDVPNEALAYAVLASGDWQVSTTDQIGNVYGGELDPFTRYEVSVTATGTSGDVAQGTACFETGRLGTPWSAKWITDSGYDFVKKESPKPMAFRRRFMRNTTKKLRRAWVNATALGIYELTLNDQKVGEDYFAPGFTSYAHQIQYQTYDVTSLLTTDNTLLAEVVGGWAVGSFTYSRKSKIYADKQAFLCELFLEYEDGSRDCIPTGTDWEVTTQGRYIMAEWYDGETFDANVDMNRVEWKAADITFLRSKPKLLAAYGVPVRVQQVMQPISCSTARNGELIYDFGQNFAGVISAKVKGKKGQTLTFRHAEVLVDGELFVKSLRTAKATATYLCKDGDQEYSPRFTYMGFRYVGLLGINPEDIELSALVLHSNIEEIGSFSCSNPLLNRLHENIRWGGKSNFVDIPTDCPQRDERQGWTGDIAVFARTACRLFDMSRFFDKWLLDMRAEQGRGGGLPMVIPKGGDGWPTMATSCWGDSCVLVPWAEYLARGDKQLLEKQYPTIRRFLKAAKWWSAGRYIWRFPFHFGDWCAPEGSAKQWIMRGKWIGTAYFANSCAITAQIAQLLGKESDATTYRRLRDKIIKAYRKAFTDGLGTLKQEFQTAYVLPLYFDMTCGEETAAMAMNLARLVRDNENHLATGFPGTPYLLFALSDNGYVDAAFDLLLQESCPSWLYEVKTGGTTIWERWDALRPDGSVNISELTGNKKEEESSGGMVSFNHYAGGAVGDWLYRRIAGIEGISGGYKTFQVAPLMGGGITSAIGKVETPYGMISSEWHIVDGTFRLDVNVPVSTICSLRLPNGETQTLHSGHHSFSHPWGK